MAEPDEMLSNMESMTGTAGQEAIIENGSDGWLNWAEDALKSREYPDYEAMINSLGISDRALEGSGEIWDEGYDELTSEWEDRQLNHEGGGGGRHGGGGGGGGRGGRSSSSSSGGRGGRSSASRTLGRRIERSAHAGGRSAQNAAIHASLRERGLHR